MNDVHIATLKLNNNITKLHYDTICDIELYDKDTQPKEAAKLSKFINSFDTFTTSSFIKISKLPMWFYLGRPFQIYTKDSSSLLFFKKLISLTVGRDAGLLIKGDIKNYMSLETDEINKDEFYLLMYVHHDTETYSIKAIPLQVSNYFIERYLKNCKIQDQNTLQSSIFIEPVNNNDKNDILDKFVGRTTGNPFVSAGSVGSHVVNLSLKQQPVVATKSNLIMDQDNFRKKVFSFINSELRMRNINPNNSDYQLLINNVSKSTSFAFRHNLESKSFTRIKVDDVRDVVIKLMDIFV